MRINTNIPAIQSYNALTATNNALSKSINKLSTGLRINSAADDAAGLAISEKMRAQYRGLDQAQNNAQDGISMIQTAEGALNETHSILQRMRELSVQAANDTLTQEDRSYIQLEIDQLRQEIDRISTTTQFNKKQLLDGSAAAVWSSDNLATRAIISGGLREVDRFGQKKAFEGNFKITIKATPGEAQVQKSDIFKIKHPNVIMNVLKDEMKGVASIRVDNLPAGTYSVDGAAPAGLADLMNAQENIAAFDANGGVISTFGQVGKIGNGKDNIDLSKLVTIDNKGESEGDVNVSLLFEVSQVNAGSNQVTFSIQAIGLDTKGNSITYNGAQIIVGSGGVLAEANSSIGIKFTDAAALKLAVGTGADGTGKASDFTVGSKFVVQALATGNAAKPDYGLAVTGKLNDNWENSWMKPATAGGTPTAGTIANGYNLIATELANKEVHFKQFYLNEANGTVHQGDTAITFNDKITKDSTGTIATFEAAYIGQIAKGDVAVRDLDKFWDANGKFMLEDPKTLQIVQGDGKKAAVTLYSTDTINDVMGKLNGAIANGLGQGKYAQNDINQFVTYVEEGKTVVNTSESVAGTMVIRSLIPGAAGTLSLSGDEDVIKAFSLNIIQDAKETKYEANIVDAHTGNTVVQSAKVTGNKLVGVLHENVDIVFDNMANIDVEWNPDAKKFTLKRSLDVYETILHLSDNSTVFQIGANEGEDMSVNIGNMSSEALGVNNLIVTDRESAARSITKIDNAINRVSTQRAKLGAYQNRLEHTINNLTTASTNLKSSESRIRDADMAKEMMEFTKLNILSQAGNSMLAQANQLPQNVLSLLR